MSSALQLIAGHAQSDPAHLCHAACCMDCNQPHKITLTPSLSPPLYQCTQPLPAESTIICEAEVESMEGRKIWLNARLTDPSGDTVYASSRALFVKPKQAPSIQPAAPSN